MKTNESLNQARRSTYALLVRSEDTKRGLFETLIYSLLVLSAVVGIWQFAHLRIPEPFANTAPTQTVSGS